MKLKASFTVEASVVIPITLFIMLALILLSFYIHDKTILVNASVSAILENANDDSDIGELKSEAYSRINAKTIGVNGTYVNVESNDGKYVLSAGSSFDWKNDFVRAFLDNSLGSAEAEVNISNLDGRRVLLEIKVLSDAARLIDQK